MGTGWITNIPGGKTWLSGDCGRPLQGKEAKTWNHTWPPHFSNSASTYSLHSHLCAPGPFQAVGMQERKGTGNDTSLPCALAKSRNPQLTCWRPNSRATRFRNSRLELREGKRLAQVHTASKRSSKGIKPRYKVLLTLPGGPPSRSSPPHQIHLCGRVRIKARPPGSSKGKSSVPLPPRPPPPTSPPHRTDKFETQGVCAPSPRKPCRLQGIQPLASVQKKKKKKKR